MRALPSGTGEVEVVVDAVSSSEDRGVDGAVGGLVTLDFGFPRHLDIIT